MVSAVLVVLGLVLVALAAALIVLAYNVSRDGFAAWPEPVFLPAAGGAFGLVMVVAGVVRWRRSRRG